MTPNNIEAWIAIILGTLAILGQAYQYIKKRRTEKTEIETALDKSPFVRDQLQLGNFGEAVKHLNSIIQMQAAHIDKQDKELAAARERITHLEDREDACEAELDKAQRMNALLHIKIERLEAQLREVNNNE